MNSVMNKISIIVPVYNISEYLPRCLESILAQTYKNIEIIAVDDGSSDSSENVLRQYSEKHDNIKVVSQQNAGVTAARMNGVAHSSGEWIGFVDGDDEIEPDMFERLYNNAVKYQAEISHCGYQMIFEDGRVHYFHNTGLLAKQDKITALKELLSGSRIEPGLWNKLFHRNLFHNLLHISVLPHDIKINEDLLMNYYLFSEAEYAVYEDRCPYHYIIRSGSASRAKLNEHKIFDPIRVKELIRNSVPMCIHDDAQMAYVNTCINICNTLMMTGTRYHAELKKVRMLLKCERKSFALLEKKRAVMAYMIVFFPIIYKPVYRAYSHCFQKNVYS